jgi:hypothetical protein
MRPWRLTPLLIAAFTTLSATPPNAAAIPVRLARIAEGGVVAVRDPYGVRTGFAFGGTDLIIAGPSVDTGVRLITAQGLSAVSAYVASSGRLAVVHAPVLRLLPVRRSSVHEISPGTLAYILGAPLGYEGDRIRAVRLPAVKLHSTRMVLVAGQLPRQLQGAPVVTQAGRVIGAVAAVGASSWTLAPQIRLNALVAVANKTGGGEGFPVISILVGALILIGVLGGLVAMRVRRTRARADRAPVAVRQRPVGRPTRGPIEDPTQHYTQPLVRRREPDVAHDDEEDFDIVLKSREDR